MSKKKSKSYTYENISQRKGTQFQKFNDFTNTPPTNPSMFVYESGHKKYCEPGWLTRMRVYDHYLIHYVLSGKGTFYTPYGIFPVSKGDIFLIKPDEAIYYIADLDDPWTYYWFGFNGNNAINIMRLCGFSDQTPVLYYGEDLILKNLLHKLAYPESSDISREYALLSHLYEIFSLFIQKQPQPVVSNAEQYLSRATEYIHKNLIYDDLTVNDVANHVGIDRTYLYRIFDNLLHQSIQDYIQKLRLEHAIGLLKFSNASISSIASNCGFRNQAYFSTVFKKHYQMSPLQYRKYEKQKVTIENTNNQIN